jgi:hypothetical protein
MTNLLCIELASESIPIWPGDETLEEESQRELEWIESGLPILRGRLGEIMGLDMRALAGQPAISLHALLSAWSAWKGLCGDWTLDLHDLPCSKGETVFWPSGRTQFFWPTRRKEKRC